jgi:hypothetical protein
LQQFLGLRQLAVAPYLQDGVQAVVIMGDVREVADEKVIERPCAGRALAGSGFPGEHVVWTLTNPTGSGVVLRVHEIEHGAVSGTAATASVGIRHEQDGTSVGFPFPDMHIFRDRLATGPVPRGLVSANPTLAAPPDPHFVMFHPSWGRAWRTGWTLYPGNRLRLDSREAGGAGPEEEVSFLWTESTLRSS